MTRIFLLIDPKGRPSRAMVAYKTQQEAETMRDTSNARLRTTALKGDYWRVRGFDVAE